MKKMLALIMLLLAPLVALPATSASAGTSPVVIMVHGHNNQPICQAVGVQSYWSNVITELTATAGVPAQDLYAVSYYKCDTNGWDMTGEGDGVTYPLTKTSGTLNSRAGYSNATSIVQLAHDLAWFSYNHFSGRPIIMIGHSMGGLIVREALRRIEAGDPNFPPSLDVPKVITVSTPHAGGTTCSGSTECAEMQPTSQFIAVLQTNPAPQAANGTTWWAMATSGTLLGSPCDQVTTASATAVGGTDLIYTSPCYSHTQYLSDTSKTLNAQGSPEIAGRHSILLLCGLVRYGA